MKFLGLLLALLPALALAEPVPVEFRTVPSPVRINGRLSNQPIYLDFKQSDPYRLKIDSDDYQEAEVWVRSDQILSGGSVYPPKDKEPIRLTPKHFWVPWKVWALASPALALALLATLGAGLASAGLWARRKIKRRTRLNEFRSQTDGNDSALLKTLGGYLLVERLGSGGMATVYRGIPVDSMDEKESVAIKILSQETMEDQAAMARFHREVRAYQSLEHKNIVRIYSWNEPQDGGSPYLVLEFVRGHTLRDVLRKGQVPINQALDWLGQLFEAIAFAHSRGTVHRDLKPENIMLDGNRVKVMDFGLARSLDASYLTQTGTVLGTPAYMAPEQLGEGATGPSIDQHALGLIAYEVLSGRRPIEETDLGRLMMRMLTEVPPPPSQHRPHLSKAVDGAILRMLAKDPKQRFEDVASAWKALRS